MASAVAAGLLILEFVVINKWNDSITPLTNSTSFDLTIWKSDFEDAANPLAIHHSKNNTSDVYQWLNTDDTKIVWTEGDEPPGAVGGGDAGGIIIPGNGNTTQIQGSITENDLPVGRRVMAITEAQLVVTDSDETKHAVLDSTVSNDIDGSYILNTSPYEGAVMIIAMDNYGALWQPDTAYAEGDVIRPENFQGYVYHCTLAGTTGNAEPVWWFETDTSQTIGTAQFQAKPFSRPLAHGPIIPTILPSE